jgi:hypothetical protein
VIVGFKKYRGQFPSFFIADWAEDRCWRIANRRGGWCWCLIPVAYAHRQRCPALRAEDTQNAGTVPAFLLSNVPFAHRVIVCMQTHGVSQRAC